MSFDCLLIIPPDFHYFGCHPSCFLPLTFTLLFMVHLLFIPLYSYFLASDILPLFLIFLIIL